MSYFCDFRFLIVLLILDSPLDIERRLEENELTAIRTALSATVEENDILV